MHQLSVINFTAILDGQEIALGGTIDDAYRVVGSSYPKFFKMDILSKWAWIATELLLKAPDTTWRYEGIDRSRIALILQTSDGCLEVDKAFQKSTEEIASPALFVYTLPNIMLGEICIRHGFKGEQLCEVVDQWNPSEASFYVRDLLQNRGMDAAIFGYVNATNHHHSIVLYWLEKLEIDLLNTLN